MPGCRAGGGHQGAAAQQAPAPARQGTTDPANPPHQSLETLCCIGPWAFKKTYMKKGKKAKQNGVGTEGEAEHAPLQLLSLAWPGSQHPRPQEPGHRHGPRSARLSLALLPEPDHVGCSGARCWELGFCRQAAPARD